MKKILLFCIIIFSLALFARVGSYLNVLQSVLGSYQYYQGIGSGSDSDYQIKNAIFVFTKGGPAEILTHYDYIFLIPLIAFFLKTFGYIKGLEYLMYLIILLGSLVPVILFLLLAKRTSYIIGSLIVGLSLAVNPLLVSVSAGRFILDTLVQFIFALFIVCYLRALEKKSFIWLILLGIIAVIQGLNKPFLMVNDLALLSVFPLFILIKKLDYKRKFPFVNITWQINKKIFFYSLIPVIVYVLGNTLWEIYLQVTINRGYFLKEIFFSNASDSSTNFALRDSLVLAQTPWEKLRNIIMFTLMAIGELRIYINISIIYFSSIIFLYIFTKRNRTIWFRQTIIVSLIFIGVYFIITKLFFVQGIATTSVPQGWTFLTFACFTVFTLLLLFFMQRSVVLLAMTALQIPYLLAVGLTLTTAIFPRHYETLVIWFMICTALLIDSFIPKVLSKFSPIVYKGVVVIILLMFSLPILQTLSAFNENVTKEIKDIGYLLWVGQQVPNNDYILVGSGENFIDIAKYTKKEILYNTTHTPTLATYNDSIFSLKDFSSADTKPMEFTKFLPKYAKEKKLFVTDLNKPGWDLLLTSGSKAEIPSNMYKLEIAQKNPRTGRVLYRLVLTASYLQQR
jgi:hypothetical protein